MVKKIVLESCCGDEIKSSGLVKQLASFLGARRGTILECYQNRVKLKQQKDLAPVLERLARKPISGDRKISSEWKLTVAGWYESDTISEVIKGHNNVFKEKLKIKDGDKTNELIFLRSKRVSITCALSGFYFLDRGFS